MFQSLLTAVRYAVRPLAYPFLLRRLRVKLGGGPASLEDTKPAAEQWCRRRAITPADALRAVGLTGEVVDVRAAFPDVLTVADRRVTAATQKLGGGADLALLHTCASELPATVVVETGVAYGWSTLALLLAVRGRAGGRVVSTNLHYREFGDESAVGLAVPEDMRDRWSLHRGPDADVLPVALVDAGAFDLCHYDSDKSYAGRMASYRLIWGGLKLGGLFLSDDIGDNLSFAHFARMTRHRPVVVAGAGGKFVGVIRKRSDRPLAEWVF